MPLSKVTLGLTRRILRYFYESVCRLQVRLHGLGIVLLKFQLTLFQPVKLKSSHFHDQDQTHPKTTTKKIKAANPTHNQQRNMILKDSNSVFKKLSSQGIEEDDAND